MYQFAKQPKWVLSHLLVAALLVAMLWAGFWQLGRLGDRQDQNAKIAARALVAEVDIAAVVPADATVDIGDDLEYLLVNATGTFDRSQEVLVNNRPLEGGPGRWVLTPLVLEGDPDGRAVIVNRGWIPNVMKPEDDRPTADPPAGVVTVTGFVRPTETATGLQVAVPADGILTTIARPNLERLGQQMPYPVLPVFIQMDQVDPPGGDLPLGLELPPLENGPHLSYAMQWFIFATIGLIGYPLILRRVAGGGGKSLPDDDDLETAAARL